MSIVEKLEIKPLRSFLMNNFVGNFSVVLEKEVRELENQRNEMLEALIDNITIGCGNLIDDQNYTEKRAEQYYSSDILIIEKAAGKSWEEIKELIE